MPLKREPRSASQSIDSAMVISRRNFRAKGRFREELRSGIRNDPKQKANVKTRDSLSRGAGEGGMRSMTGEGASRSAHVINYNPSNRPHPGSGLRPESALSRLAGEGFANGHVLMLNNSHAQET